MISRYVIIDSAGLAESIVVWDGETEWTPPEGCTVALEDSDEGQAALLAAQPEPEEPQA